MLDPDAYEIKFSLQQNGKAALIAVTGKNGFEGSLFKTVKIDPSIQKGTDGTAFGPGASIQAVEKAIAAMKSDADPKGTKYAPLKLRNTKRAKTSITVKWTKKSGAKKYVLYGNKCGKKNKMKKIGTYTGSSKKVTKAAGKKLKKKTYYKFMVVALDKNNNVVSSSKIIHVATKGSKKASNHTKVTVKKKVIKKAAKLTTGKKLSLKAKAVKKKGTKVRKHRVLKYESSNTKVATVTSKGTVKAVKKGTCYIYAYAQNGKAKAVKVKVIK